MKVECVYSPLYLLPVLLVVERSVVLLALDDGHDGGGLALGPHVGGLGGDELLLLGPKKLVTIMLRKIISNLRMHSLAVLLFIA